MSRAAPPVALVITAPRAWRLAGLLLGAAAGAALSRWSLPWLIDLDIWPAGTALAVALAWGLAVGLTACGAAWGWVATHQPEGELRFDGAGWLFEGRPGTAQIALDLGLGLLLRHRGAGRTRWLAVSRRRAGAAWHGLRVALHAPPPQSREAGAAGGAAAAGAGPVGLH